MDAVVTEQLQCTREEAEPLLESVALCDDAQEQAMRLRNQQRIAEALAREPDWEGLKEGYKVVQELRQEAKEAGLDQMSMEDVDAVISECRRKMRQEQK